MSGMRMVVLDTETTGMDPAAGHRIVEIGMVELVDRRRTNRVLHHYLNPERHIDDGAREVHGIDDEFLADKPKFAEIVDALLEFVSGAEIIAHNAAFDVAFLNHEISLLPGREQRIGDLCTVTDSLQMARDKHPGLSNSLDALCRRYGVDNSARDRHGALLDAEILTDVYLRMTGGQLFLFGERDGRDADPGQVQQRLDLGDRRPLVVQANPAELQAHEELLDCIDRASGGSVWRRIEPPPSVS